MEAYRRVHIFVNVPLVGSLNGYFTVDNAVRGIYAVRITAKIPESLYDELANQGIVVCSTTDVFSPLMFLSDIHFSSHAPSSSRKIDHGLLLAVHLPNLSQASVGMRLHPYFNFFAECKES